MDVRADNGELIPISLVAHEVFCSRRAWLEANGERVDSYQMTVGAQAHSAADNPQASRAANLKAIDIVDSELGIVGRCDTVRVDPGGELTVVEHKATPIRRKPEVTDPMRIQLALQALALTNMGLSVVGAQVYFVTHKVNVDVELSDQAFQVARDWVSRTRETIKSVEAPPPLEDSPKCMRCSHVSVCLPDERKLAPVTRTIVVADPDSQILHLATPGSRATTRKGRVVVRKSDEELASIPIERVQGLVVHGNVDISGALIREILWRSLTVVWCSGSGRVVGWASPADGPNGAARVAQHVQSATGNLQLARAFVGSKIANQATMLRRNGSGVETEMRRLRSAQRKCVEATSLEELLGYEGDAAATYFGSFSSMLKVDGLSLLGRSGRAAMDPLNAALNYVYGMLVADVIRAIVACGLDPHAGFLHSSARNKPALALDLCEEFRPVVADSVVVRCFNNGEITVQDFTDSLGTVRLRDRGRRALIAAYEARVQTKFAHPTFGYDVTWRRAMEVQARLVLGVIDGTQHEYRGIRVR